MDMSDTQKAVMLTYTAAAISQLNTSIELNCAWQASVGLNFNVAFPDGNAFFKIRKVQGELQCRDDWGAFGGGFGQNVWGVLVGRKSRYET